VPEEPSFRRDRNQHQLDEDGETINSTGDKFMQPSDEDAQGNVLPDEEIERKRMADVQQTPSKEDKHNEKMKRALYLPSNPETDSVNDTNHESEQMKKLFADLVSQRQQQKQFKEQGEKHTMEIAALKRANLDTQNILTTKTTPAQTMSDHRSTAHFNAMTKPSDTLFDGTPENWPALEHHLLTEAETSTISWNQDITN
jgi:hypothetical protein